MALVPAWQFLHVPRHERRPPEALAACETACRFANADYFVSIATAGGHGKPGNWDKAVQDLAQTLDRYPALTAAIWRQAFRFPFWAHWVEADESWLQVLIELGLTAE
ncbi:hypothetical protein SAMN04488239_11622 [Ruegeria marina]|uniref:Uncharacterized protein n=1 Tax=Ruegeria marina TaxID=639004 RepID=A0A1G7B949_9RHOB|nr:hypothetical protein SAMN04488239_11622 [Ruegeria marina]